MRRDAAGSRPRAVSASDWRRWPDADLARLARFFRASEYLVFGTPWPFVDLVAGLGFPVPGAFAVMSALSESVGAVLTAMGWLTRWAALALVIDMSVALFNEGSKGDPIELPALYLVGALTLMITGPGRFALDRWQRAERRATMSKVHSPNAASI